MVKKIVMVVLMPTTLLANAYAASIQDSLRTTIYFRPGYSLLELSYRDNAANMKALTQGIQTIKGNPCVQLQHIRILSAASPEGNSALNKRVAKRRGERLRDYLKETLVLPDSIFTVSSAGEDWQGLASLIAKEKTPWRNKALQIIRHTPEWITRNGKVVDGRKRQLQNLDGGKAWKYMLDNHFYTLRTGAVVVCEVKTLAAESTPSAAEARLEQARSEQARLESASQQSASQSPSSPPFPAIPSQVHPSSESQAPPVASYFALKSNLHYDALLVPNLSLEASIGSGWTLGAGGMLAWWSKDAKHRYWRIYGGDLEIRKYFGTLQVQAPAGPPPRHLRRFPHLRFRVRSQGLPEQGHLCRRHQIRLLPPDSQPPQPRLRPGNRLPPFQLQNLRAEGWMLRLPGNQEAKVARPNPGRNLPGMAARQRKHQ